MMYKIFPKTKTKSFHTSCDERGLPFSVSTLSFLFSHSRSLLDVLKKKKEKILYEKKSEVYQMLTLGI